MEGTIEVGEPYFGQLRAGTKRVEGKKANKKWRDAVAGGHVRVADKAGRSFRARVRGTLVYASVEEYLAAELDEHTAEALGLEAQSRRMLELALPGVATVEAGARVYYGECGWTPEEVAASGVLAIVLEPLE